MSAQPAALAASGAPVSLLFAYDDYAGAAPSVNPVAPAAPVRDAPSEWALDEVVKAREFGLIPSNMYHSFTSNISRLEFCRLIMALYIKITGEPEKQILLPAFTDTNNISVLNAHDLGIVKGVGGGYFAPYAAITRQEIAVMIFNASNVISGATGKDILHNPGAALAFADIALADGWAVEAIRSLRNNEIMLGDNKNHFNPLDNTTKEMAFILINRIYLIYSGLDARKAFPAAYTGEILMRIKGTFTSSGDHQIIGDIYEPYPDVKITDIDRYLNGEAFTDGSGQEYRLDRSESLSESVAAGYTGGTAVSGQYYPVYVLTRAGLPQNRLYIILNDGQYGLFMDSGQAEPFLQKTFSDVIFTVPGDTVVYPAEAGAGTPGAANPGAGPRGFEQAVFTEIIEGAPDILDAYIWLIQLTTGRVTRLTAVNYA